MPKNFVIKNSEFLKIIYDHGEIIGEFGEFKILDTKTIAESLVCSPRTVVLRMKEMEKSGLVLGKTKGSKWEWMITENGIDAVRMFIFYMRIEDSYSSIELEKSKKRIEFAQFKKNEKEKSKHFEIHRRYQHEINLRIKELMMEWNIERDEWNIERDEWKKEKEKLIKQNKKMQRIMKKK